jgi:hypothetical protein
MRAYRKKPYFKITSLPSSPLEADTPASCIWMPLNIGIGYIVISAIVRLTFNDLFNVNRIIYCGILFFLLVILLLFLRGYFGISRAEEEEKKRWVQNCKSAELAILSRHDGSVWWDECANRYRTSRCCIELEKGDGAIDDFPIDTTITAELDHNILERLKSRDNVRIYYLPESPLTFLLEEEI